jgi:hypothetical protein
LLPPLPKEKHLLALSKKDVPGYLQLFTRHQYRTVAGVDTG